jgi:valyl-tRNA synthetase
VGGQSVPGNKGQGEQKKEKTERELAKERAKAEKLRKLEEKKAKAAAMQPKAAKEGGKEKKKPAKEEVVLAEYVEQTPKGQKKILKSLDDPYCSSYHPKVVESAWMDWWKAEKFFEPKFKEDGEVQDEGYFVIPIPPPNVTGALHIGHALATSLQDVLIRWHRMKGFTTLYVPGCDHAGISTQSVVEKILWRREKKTRHDLGRPALVAKIWEWKEDYHMRIRSALDRLGGSYDWSREGFTMDKNLSAAVLETFVRLHEEGLIYRSNRLVSWDPTLRTALSNIEVINKDLEGRTLLDVPGYDRKVEFGVLTYFKYPIEGTDETITVATTRPETMLGDSGVAVNPKDTRYQHLIGKKVKHPFVDRLLPIFADDYVDMEFGTGAVKITPAHDANDWTLGERHKLQFINIMNKDGTLNANAGPMFEGKRRFDVRYEVKAELEKLGLFVKQENNPMKVPLGEKSNDVVEPLMLPQWWMKMKDMANAGLEAEASGKVKIRPESAQKNFRHWMSNIQDWCLSRQLWWGHQCPAYLIELEGEEVDDCVDASWVVARTEEEAQKQAAERHPGKKFTLTRDPDVLDTWFSSGLWPFSTLGWPNQTHDLEKLFPTSVLETGWDILFPWVARMIMLSLKLTGKVPFNEVYCHSLIRDSEGRKMSKSLGNVVAPEEIMDGISLKELNEKLLTGNLDPKELKTASKYQHTAFPQGIPECGTDALRFSLVQYTTGGGDVAFDIRVIHAYRRFANKIYQATKYILGKLPEGWTPKASSTPSKNLSLSEAWILTKFNNAAKDVNQMLEDREFSNSTQVAYKYIYDCLCDVFIENSKAILQDGSAEEQESALETLYTATEGALLLIHPYMPYLSEELWQRLPRRQGDETKSICIAKVMCFNQTGSPLTGSVSPIQRFVGVILEAGRGVRDCIRGFQGCQITHRRISPRSSQRYDFQLLIYSADNCPVYIHSTTPAAHSTIVSQTSSIRSLSGKGLANLTALSPSDPLPTGSAVYVATADIAVFLEVKGRVDIDEEIKKTQAKLKKAAEGSQKLSKLINSSAFKEKSSKGVYAEEQAKLDALQAQERNYEKSLEQFTRLKL